MMAKLNFQHYYSSLQCDSMLICKKHFLFLSMLKTDLCWNWYFIFRIL